MTGRLQEWRRQGVSCPQFLSLSSGHLSSWAILLLLLIAWLTPTAVDARPLGNVWDYLSQPLLGLSDDAIRLAGPIKTNRPLRVHGFSSVLPFRGSIELSSEPVASVTVEEATGLAGQHFLRVGVYDEYQAGGWKAVGRQEVVLPAADLGEAAEEIDSYRPAGTRAMRARIQVADNAIARSLVFSVGQPLAADVETKAELPSDAVYRIDPDREPDSSWPMSVYVAASALRAQLGVSAAVPSDERILDLLPPGLVRLSVMREGSTVERVDVALAEPVPDIVLLKPAQKFRPGDTYTVLGLVTDYSADELRAAGETYPAWVSERYRQLPRELPQRVKELAAELTAASATPYDKAKAVEGYLRLIPVDYEMPDVPPARDAVDYFLFDAREGYFDYHASAMVVLLRAVGVPARLAVGYRLDPSAFDSRTRQYNVREAHAYAWTEVHFPGVGWVPFDPSPERPAAMRPGELSGGGRWFGVDPLLPDFLFPLGGVAPVPPEGRPPTAAVADEGGGYFFVVWLVAGLAIAGGAAVVGGRLAWERGLAGLPYCQRVWEQTIRLATWARLGPQLDQTPREYARHLAERVADLEGLDLLAEAYGRSRFSGKRPADDEAAQLRPIWRRMRNRLLARIFFRR